MRIFAHVGAIIITIALCLSFAGDVALSAPETIDGVPQLQQGQATATANNAINVRGGPDTGFWIVGLLNAGETVPILGVSPDSAWWLINTGFGQGWVASSVVTAANTSAVPVNDPGPSVAVTAGQLNVRAGAGIGASSLGLLTFGNRVFLIGQSADAAWLNVRTQFGTGWIASNYTSAGSVAAVAPVTSAQPIAIVNAASLNVRTGPGVNYAIIGQVQGGDELSILGSSADRAWFNVQTAFGEGWVSDLYVVTRNEFGSAPVNTDVDPTTVEGPFAIVNAFALNVRSGPAVAYQVQGIAAGGDQFQIVGQDPSLTWFLLEGAEFDGWVNRIYVIVRGDISGIPVVTVDEAATVVDPNTGQPIDVAPEIVGPIAFVATGALNVRSGPNVAFEPLGFVYAATRMSIVGQSADGNWWQVDSPFGLGWVTKRLVIVENGPANVPVVQ